MKITNYTFSLLALSTVLASAAVVNFENLTFEQSLTTVPGWSASGTNPSNAPLAWVESIALPGGSSTLAGAIGGAYASASTPTFSVNYDAPSVYGTTVSFSSSLYLSGSSAGLGHDSFSVALATGTTGNPLFSIIFAPSVDLPDGYTRWEVGYAVSGGDAIYTGFTVTESNFYNFSLDVTGSAFNFAFSNSLGSQSYNGTIAGYNSAVNGLGDVSFSWTKDPAQAEHGDNFLAFDNISTSAVPEPSVALLSSLAALALLRRKR